MNKELDWPELRELAVSTLKKRGLNGIYEKRLAFELDEIEKQGANRYWTEVLSEQKTFNNNKNGLLLPWLLGRIEGEADKDPLGDPSDLTLSTNYKKVKKYIDKHKHLPPDITQDDDKPDIDIDCLPEARDKIKEYAAERYGRGKVASVGTWTTYKLKQAIQDTAGALGLSKARATSMTVDLPEAVDDMKDGGFADCKGCKTSHKDVICPKCGQEDTENPTIGQIIAEYSEIQKYINEEPEHAHVIETAARLVGKVRAAGKHAGAIIIADRELLGNVPMSYNQKSDQWSSLWTEGRSTQLSKFGYNKWDMLGLKNLKYIYECCKMIERNHGVSFGDRMEGWYENIDPEIDQAGFYWTTKNGKRKRHKISLNDENALALANNQKTDGVFQFDTDLAKRILGNGVTSFWDLMIFNAMGHPGPMNMIPEYVERRNDETETWKLHENKKIAEILGVTAGVIVWQEQLQSLWQNIGGFTAPEAQSARKAVAKKWREKLKPIRQKWIDGAKKIIGEASAIEWWDDRMETFGRYAFNKSHNVAYCLIAYQCLWLKAYYAEEWWASLMSFCHPKRLIRYMNSARGDKVKFGSVNINRLTTNFQGNSFKGKEKVSLGLVSLKNVGDSLCKQFTDDDVDGTHSYESLDEFIEKKGKNKTLLERLIKLGAFQHIHPNVLATWEYYRYKHCSGKEITALRKKIRALLLEKEGWDDLAVVEEVKRQSVAYRTLYPNRTRIPPKILNWKPKPKDDYASVMGLFDTDYELDAILEYEKQYLGYYWHSPADLYMTSGRATIDMSKQTGILQGVITDIVQAQTKAGQDMYKLFVNDGNSECLLILWQSDMPQPAGLMKIDAGIEAQVNYDEKRGSFTLQRGTRLAKLWSKKGWEEEKTKGYEEEAI